MIDQLKNRLKREQGRGIGVLKKGRLGIVLLLDVERKKPSLMETIARSV